MKINDYDNLRRGDCFFLNINSFEKVEYDKMRLALIIVDKKKDNEKKVVDIKIKLLPFAKDGENILEVLLNSEFIKMKIIWLEQRFFPINGNMKFEDHMNEIKKLKCFPNEYGMLFDYNYQLILGNDNKIVDKLEYVGNFELTYPKDDFHNNYVNSGFSFLRDLTAEKLTKIAVEAYEKYNLKKSEYFDIERAKEARQSWIDLLLIEPYGELYVQRLKSGNNKN